MNQTPFATHLRAVESISRSAQRAGLARLRTQPVLLLSALLCLGLAAPASAQVLWQESFDAVGTASVNGPSALLSAGYEFRHVMSGAGVHEPWKQGPWHAGQSAQHAGTGFLSTMIAVPPFADGSVASWMIMPALPNTAAGRELSLWVKGMTSNSGIPGSVELRWSPSGGTSTGTTIQGVGDFTVVLDANLNASFTQWDQLLGVTPGTGRAAVRWIGTYSGNFSGTTLDLALDDAQFLATAVAPPLPQPGQTVHWTSAMSPVHLTTQQYVPVGGTLVIDAGVEVFIDFYNTTFGGPEIWVAGELVLDGVAGNPVVIDHGPGLAHLPAMHGHATLRHAVIRVKLGGEIDAANCTFERATPVDWQSMTDSQWDTPGLFCGTYSGGGTSARIVDSLFVNAVADFNESFAIVTGCTFDGARLRFGRYFPASDVLVRGNTFRNMTSTPPLMIDGWNADLRDNTFTNNLYPIQLAGGGLTPGSELPTSGNVNNRILVAGGTQVFLWKTTVPETSIPYYVQSGGYLDYYPADVEILPRANLLMGPGAFLSALGSQRLRIRGEPGNTVRFSAAVPGFPWTTLQFGFNSRPLLQSHFEVSGATYGVGAGDTLLLLQNGTFLNNVEGVRSGEHGKVIVAKSRFHGNQIGMHAVPGLQGPIETGYIFANWPNLPNALVGNGQGAVGDTSGWSPSDLKSNWWGQPSGPTSPSNPGGTGDSATLGLDVTPFETVAPNFSDHPPVVRALSAGPATIVRAGEKVILSWTARDDGTIVSQRLERVPNSGYNWFTPEALTPPLPPHVRSVEFTIRDWNAMGDTRPFVRITAVDDRGQEGFDDFTWTQDYAGTLHPTMGTDLTAGATIGHAFDFVWLGAGSGTANVSLFFDDLGVSWSRGTHAGQIDAMFNKIPAVSTDLARYGFEMQGQWTFSPYFTIRPEARVGNDAPDVQIAFPHTGTTFTGGSVIPLRWNASDDTGLRSFDVHVSCNGGWTWFPVAVGMDPAARAIDWRLPGSTGVGDLRLRVVARDEHFQVTSSTTGPLAVFTGNDALGDCNGNGLADIVDIDSGTSFDTNHDTVPDECAVPAVPYCFGDGSGTACPCGNESAVGSGGGCLNDIGATARLSTSGVAGVFADSLALHGSGMPDSFALYIQGSTRAQAGAGFAFGDGLLCIGGAVLRLGVRSNSGGASQFSASATSGVGAAGAVAAPGTRTYQVWYRSAGMFCSTATFNLSNGVEVTWSL